jgi:flavin reductase (DIM6/NTAB) family NADH-FMN oxidoreductase RutF
VTACPQSPYGAGDPVFFEDLPQASGDDLRQAFRRHPAGVAVITVAGLHGPVGLTVTSLVSVSAEPPRLAFNISHTSSAWPAVSLTRHLGVHLLGADQHELAATFARSGADRFAAPTVWAPGPRRVPVIEGCVTWMVGAVDQSIVVVRVLHVGGRPDGGEPLVYHDGAFRELAAGRGRVRRPA